MRIIVQAGNSPRINSEVCAALAKCRDDLRAQDILYPRVVGEKNHSRLHLAATNDDAGFLFGSSEYSDAAARSNLRTHIIEEIAAEIRAVRPRLLVVGLPYAAVNDDLETVSKIFQILSVFSDDLYALLQIAPDPDALAEYHDLQIRHGAIEPKSPPTSDKIIPVWQEIFGKGEVIVQNVENLDMAWKGLAQVCGFELQIPKVTTASALAGPSAVRLIDANKALVENSAISAELRDKIHSAVLTDANADISDTIAKFQSDIEDDLKSARIRSRVQKRINSENTPQPNEGLTEGGAKFLDENGKAQVDAVRAGQFRPRNTGIVNFDESIIPPALDINPEIEPTGTLVIACIKNEAPYILEWIAHHQGIGVDDFLIYSNDCSDGSTEILNRLDEMGVIHHKNNDEWKGKSPQQAALNDALKHKAYRKAKWIAHIDIDEFINLRWGQTGTLPELYAMMGDATNLAMTWRMFGHNGIQDFADEPVIKQFTGAVPAFCPKPHTAWGFKTLLRNDGHYGKLSCHRPNKLVEGREADVKWLNGSLMPMGENVNTQGWRSSIANIGYNAVQLNHYALRSADSFLVKRQRGRALHVDRSIGLNYWIRMDWNLHREMTIQRFLPRTAAGIATLKSDPVLAEWHQKGADWHRAKAEELKQTQEFSELYEQATTIRLTDDERVAATLAADMES